MYRMMILLEESINDEERKEQEELSGKEVKKTHEFVEELLMPFHIDELDILNVWFDKFDKEICIENEGHIKYEITSDGLIVLILDKELEALIERVKQFVEENSS